MTASGAVLYPDHYCWYVFVGMMDVVLTWVILVLGGREVNAVANAAINLAGHWGLLALKAGSIVVVVLICEKVGRMRRDAGLSLARAAVIISAIAPVWALVQLAMA